MLADFGDGTSPLQGDTLAGAGIPAQAGIQPKLVDTRFRGGNKGGGSLPRPAMCAPPSFGPHPRKERVDAPPAVGEARPCRATSSN